MTIKIIYFPSSAAIKKALSVVAEALAQKHTDLDAVATAAEIMPLVTATLDLAELSGKLEDTTCVLSQQIRSRRRSCDGLACPEACQRLRREA